jgi:hypothetical protein
MTVVNVTNFRVTLPAGPFIFSGPLVVVAWTDQLAASANEAGTRIWTALYPGTFADPATGTAHFKPFTPRPRAAQPVNSPYCRFYCVEVFPQSGTYNQFFPSITFSGYGSVFIGFYAETPGAIRYASGYTSETSSATLSFMAARAAANDQSFTQAGAISRGMPLPTAPVSPAYCYLAVNHTVSANLPASLQAMPVPQSVQTFDAECNAVPYFGAYTGSAGDGSGGAYLSYTDTSATQRNFLVSGSQDVYVAHVN